MQLAMFVNNLDPEVDKGGLLLSRSAKIPNQKIQRTHRCLNPFAQCQSSFVHGSLDLESSMNTSQSTLELPDADILCAGENTSDLRWSQRRFTRSSHNLF